VFQEQRSQMLLVIIKACTSMNVSFRERELPNDLKNLQSENKYLSNMRLYALWLAQEAKENEELQNTLQRLRIEYQNAMFENNKLYSELYQCRQLLSEWESKLIGFLQVRIPLGDNIQDLYMSNNNLKNEIRRIYNGNLNDFQSLEKDTRNMRLFNKQLKSEIDRISESLSKYRSENQALSLEIKNIKRKITAVQQHLTTRQREATARVFTNQVQNNTTDEEDLQLPRNRRNTKEYEEMKKYLVDNKNAVCPICTDPLNDSFNGQIVVTPCGHRFHEKCMQPIFRSQQNSWKCPTCRRFCSPDKMTSQINWNVTQPLYSCFCVSLKK